MYHCTVKEKMSIKSFIALVYIFGMVLLLLFSPCNVRKQIQSEFGIPQTEVSNKSKASAGANNCSSQELTDYALRISKPSVISVTASAVKTVSNHFLPKEIAILSLPHYTTRKHDVSFVPFYILYQNFKGSLS